MGIELLEEKFQRFCRRHPEHVPRLGDIATHVARVQTGMRKLLDPVTQRLCPQCRASCCECMPVEGWFTESDYYLYRMRHDPPLHLRVNRKSPRGCAFLGPQGCTLPADIRPFPCVKVNCASVTRELEKTGNQEAFTLLFQALDAVQDELWPLVREDVLSDCGEVCEAGGQ